MMPPARKVLSRTRSPLLRLPREMSPSVRRVMEQAHFRGGRTPSPADFGARLIAWYRAGSDTYTPGSWTDLGPNGYTLTNTPPKQPTLTTRGGVAALSFDGGDWVFQAAPNINQPLGAFVVLEPTSLASGRVFVDSGDPAAANIIRMSINATPQWALNAGPSLVGGTPTLAPHALSFLANGVNSFIHANDFRTGQEIASGDVGSGFLDGLSIGAAFNGGSGYLGYIWEVVLVSSPVADDRKIFAKYINSRGIAGVNVLYDA